MNLSHAGRRAVAAALLAMASASAAATAPAPEASIPFVQFGAIRNWRADGDRGLWVQDVRRQWYYARLMGPCIGLRYAEAIGFDTRPMGTFDKFSAIVVPYTGRCMIESFTRSEGPQRQKEKAANS